MEIMQIERNQAIEDGIETQELVDNIIQNIDNTRRLLQKQKERIDRVKVKHPTIEVRYRNLCAEVECKVVDGKPLPTLWNTFKAIFTVSFIHFFNLLTIIPVPQQTVTIRIGSTQ